MSTPQAPSAPNPIARQEVPREGTRDEGFSPRLLSHPLVLGCVALTALNDHVLKAAYPGFLTGKISDFAGLFFFPILVAETAARLLPGGREVYLSALRATALVGGLAFAAAKVSEPVRDAFVDAFSAAFFPVRVACDPGDLVALAVLPIAYRFASRRV